VAATEAAQAAKDADKYAKEAQDAADRTEREQANHQVQTGAGSGMERVFYVIDENASKIVDSKPLNECPYNPSGCTVTWEIHSNLKVDYYYCTNPDVPATETGCPAQDTVYLDSQWFNNQESRYTHSFSFKELTQLGWEAMFGKIAGDVLFQMVLGDAIDCFHGNQSGCVWAAANFFPATQAERLFKAVQTATRVENAIRTGVDAEKVLADLKKVYGEKGAEAAIHDPASEAGMALRLSLRMADRAKAAAPGLDMRYVNKLKDAGIKFDQKSLYWVTPYANSSTGLVRLERGYVKGGFVHIIFRHAGEFGADGVPIEEIPKLLKTALEDAKIVGYQGSGTGRPIFETVYNNKVRRVAISVSQDGARSVSSVPD
jgi:hypothetical protein